MLTYSTVDRWVKTSDKLKQDEQQWASQPSKDYSLKQGQTITIKLGVSDMNSIK
jgi:hypothetical protein